MKLVGLISKRLDTIVEGEVADFVQMQVEDLVMDFGLDLDQIR